MLASAGCGYGRGDLEPGPLPANPAPAAQVGTSPAAAVTPEAAVLAQYRALLGSLAPLSRAPVLERPALVDKLAVPPARSSIMAALAQADLAGEVFYGTPASRQPQVVVSGSTATVRDCQDTSQNGRKRLDSGRITAHGVAHDPAVLTFELGTDGVWRVATVSYPGGSC
ncbi:MAG: hypothetical protein L0Y54_02155 [Sporichthyaceae bacterium]|nr:hypothetical protein [Sporichthyaceae bacterium]